MPTRTDNGLESWVQ